MIEYWAVLGLAIIDEEFREALAKAKRDTGKLRRIVRDYGFRLSRYELGELQRVINSKDPKDPKVNVLDLMHKIHHLIWFEDDPCWPAMTPNPKYRHPYLVLVPYPDSEHVKSVIGQPPENESLVAGFVDPVTGKPLKTEKRNFKPAKVEGPHHSPRK